MTEKYLKYFNVIYKIDHERNAHSCIFNLNWMLFLRTTRVKSSSVSVISFIYASCIVAFSTSNRLVLSRRRIFAIFFFFSLILCRCHRFIEHFSNRKLHIINWQWKIRERKISREKMMVLVVFVVHKNDKIM